MERPPEEGNWCLKEPEMWGKGRQGTENNKGNGTFKGQNEDQLGWSGGSRETGGR